MLILSVNLVLTDKEMVPFCMYKKNWFLIERKNKVDIKTAKVKTY